MDEFDVEEDKELQEAFRGHLVIACSALEEDLELAAKITERFKEEFGPVSIVIQQMHLTSLHILL